MTAQITLTDGTIINLDKRNTVSIDTKLIDRADTKLPRWGIVSNKAKLTFVDYDVDDDGSVKKLLSSLKLTSKTTASVYIKNTLTGASADYGKYFAESWDYDNDNRKVTVSLSDGIEKLQDINFDPYLNKSIFVYDLSKSPYALRASEIYNALRTITVNNGFDMLDYNSLDKNTISHINLITITYPYIEASSLWNVWQNFAEALQCHLYKNASCKIVFRYNGGD